VGSTQIPEGCQTSSVIPRRLRSIFFARSAIRAIILMPAATSDGHKWGRVVSTSRKDLQMHPGVDRLAPFKPIKKTNGNDLAPSVAQADAILAEFGYTETRELAAA